MLSSVPRTGPASKQAADTKLSRDDVTDLKGTAVWGEPFVGVEVVTLDERGEGALPARPLPSPKQPTPHQVALHNLTHLPYQPWCTICVACRKPNQHHRHSHSERHIPLMVADYAFVRNKGDDVLVPLLIGRLYPIQDLFRLRRAQLRGAPNDQ